MPTPSDKTLEKELRSAVKAILEEGSEVTVNKVRTRAEEKLDLPDSFFKNTADWKNRSKEVIHMAMEGGESDEEPIKEAKKPTKKTAAKRQSSEEPEQKPKRVKKEIPPKKPVKKAARPKKKQKKAISSDESELSDLAETEEEEEEEEKKPKKRGQQAKKVESESELSDLGSDEEEEEEVKPNKAAVKGRLVKRSVISDDHGDEDMDQSEAQPKKRSKIQPDNGDETAEDEAKDENIIDNGNDTKTTVENDDSSELSSVVDDAPPRRRQPSKEGNKSTNVDDSSDLSSVIDDGPPTKRRGKAAKGATGTSKSKAPKVSKAAPKEVTADEAEIKKLQSQLLKCGIRKIWGFELKEYGDDTKGKIRHLRKMLTDAGMTGRFSEAKAQEIKERRELLADLDAVQEMNDLWGTEGRGGRASRSRVSRAKAPLKEASDDEDESEIEDVKPRVSKRQADLAFLGSESEDDSD